MKKTLIAAAVATAFAGSAMAQVTVSGRLDFGHSQTKTTATTTVTKTSAQPGEGMDAWTTSQVVFQASEDLGGGLKGGANVAAQIRSDSTTAAYFGDRDTFVFVSGGFGHLSLGRRETAINTAFDKFNVIGTTNGAGSISFSNQDVMAGTMGNSSTRGNFTRQKGLQLTSPTFNGFNVALDYSNDSSEVNTLAGKTGSAVTAMTVNYSAGPLSFVIATGEAKTKTAATAATTGRAYFFNGTTNATGTGTTTTTTGAVGTLVTGDKTGWTITTVNGAAAPDLSGSTSVGLITVAGVAASAASEGKAKTSLIGASYNLGVAEVRVGHTMRKDEAAAATVSDLKVTTLGVAIPMGSVRLFASAYDGKDDRTSSTTDDVDFDGRQVGLTYAFSKRTMAYAYTGKNDRVAKSTGITERKDEGTHFGIVHNF